jgi:uncharacterized membrane protein YraQ (UPF0718 family)
VDSWNLLLQLWIYLLIGIVLTALFQAFIDKQKLSNWVVKHPHISIIGAAGFGVISPLGTYVCIPMAGSLYAKGTPLAPLMAFLVASPILNPTIFMLTVGAFGTQMAVLRLISGILLGITAGYIFLIPGLKKGNFKQDENVNADKKINNKLNRNYLQRFLKELKGSTLYMMKYFLIALVIAAAIKNLISTEQVNWLLGNGSFLSVVIATGAGIPLYSCGGAAIPVLYQLSEMGMTKGAVLAFFISGPSTRISNLVILSSVFNLRILFIYLGVVIAGAISLGFLYNLC